MKKIAMILTVGLVSLSLAISQESSAEKNAEAEAKVKANIVLTYGLADYGYENDSASALLQSAEIMMQVQKDLTTVEFHKDEKPADEVVAEEKKPEYTADGLIADAKKLAGKDKNLLAWAKSLEKAAKTSTRGYGYGNRYVNRPSVSYTCSSCGAPVGPTGHSCSKSKNGWSGSHISGYYWY